MKTEIEMYLVKQNGYCFCFKLNNSNAFTYFKDKKSKVFTKEEILRMTYKDLQMILKYIKSIIRICKKCGNIEIKKDTYVNR